MREKKVEDHLRDRVKATGGIIRKVQWVARRGAPDDWCGWPATRRNGWVETKRPKTPKAAAHQAREHQRMRDCGADVAVLYTLEQVDLYVAAMSGINIGQVRAL